MKKHFLYLKYLARHKWFVFVAGIRVGVPLWRLLVHDWSKFLPCEWFPYVAIFYGPSGYKRDKTRCSLCGTTRNADGVCSLIGCKDPLHDNRVRRKIGAAFDRAWLHHQHSNPHHWQHWVLREDSGETKFLEMPDAFVREMVADWLGAGRAINGRWEAAAWYEKNRDRIQLNANTRVRVEWLLDLDRRQRIARSAGV